MPFLINLNDMKCPRLTIPLLVMSLNQTLVAITVSLQSRIQTKRLGLSLTHKLYHHYYSNIFRSKKSTMNKFFRFLKFLFRLVSIPASHCFLPCPNVNDDNILLEQPILSPANFRTKICKDDLI